MRAGLWLPPLLVAQAAAHLAAPPAPPGEVAPTNGWHNASDVARLRHDLLHALDPRVPPTPGSDGRGTEIGVQLRIFKVVKVDIAAGAVSLMVWRRSKWRDPRLTWDPDDYGGTRRIEIYPTKGGNDIDSKMWTPDLVFYNTISKEEDVLGTGAAWVNRDGSVWQTVPGTIDLACQFTDLVNFPRDMIDCRVEIASWSLSDLVTNLTFYEEPERGTRHGADRDKGDRGCAEISAQSASTASTYQEYSIDFVECEKHTRVYPCCADEPWTQLWVHIHLRRAHFYYRMLLEIPGILITLLSFSVFFLDVRATGERLGFGSTMMLTMLVLALIASDKLPVCGELLWIQVLNSLNMCFGVLAVLQSCYVTHICFAGTGKGDEERAERCDYWARRIVPPLYLSLLGVLYSIRFDDKYARTSDSNDFHLQTFQGAPPSWEVAYVGAGLATPLVCCGLALAWRAARKAKLALQHRTSQQIAPPDAPPMSTLAC